MRIAWNLVCMSWNVKKGSHLSLSKKSQKKERNILDCYREKRDRKKEPGKGKAQRQQKNTSYKK